MRTAALILQSICVILTASGLSLGFIRDANLPYLLITAGSFIFAVSVKVTKIALIRERNKLLNDKDNNHG